MAAVVILAAPLAHANDLGVIRSASSVHTLAKGDYAAASKLGAVKLKQAWTELQAGAGDYRTHAATARQTLQGRRAVGLLAELVTR